VWRLELQLVGIAMVASGDVLLLSEVLSTVNALDLHAGGSEVLENAEAIRYLGSSEAVPTFVSVLSCVSLCAPALALVWLVPRLMGLLALAVAVPSAVEPSKRLTTFDRAHGAPRSAAVQAVVRELRAQEEEVCDAILQHFALLPAEESARFRVGDREALAEEIATVHEKCKGAVHRVLWAAWGADTAEELHSLYNYCLARVSS